ncbi:MAG: C-GCAxxG-C-C family protein [Desulfovibrionaceae bacterium]|nr:C-GCAxxG-C-C family protein [Desulfovibrionaceae bacterium]
MTVERNARQLMQEGWLCAESVLLAVTRAKGLESPLIPRLATAFCSGLARTCGTCGAVTGGILALSLFVGRDRPERELLDLAYAPTQHLIEGFTAAYGSTNCYEIIGCDFRTPEGQARYKEANMRETCLECVALAVRLALEALDDAGHGIRP